MTAANPPQRGVSLAMLAASLVIVLALYWSTSLEVFGYWRDTVSGSHGLLLFPVCLWLAFSSIGPGHDVTRGQLGLGFVAAVMLSLAWSFFASREIASLQLALLPALWLAAAWCLLGKNTWMQVAWIIATLFFAMPLWWPLTSTLQSLATSVVTLGLRVGDIPAYIDGNIVALPNGTFEVAEGCSGLHQLIVAQALGWIAGEIFRIRYSMRLVAYLGFVILALVSNWIRVFSLVLIGYYTDMQHYFVAVDHYYYGWAIFSVLSLAYLYWLSRRNWTGSLAASANDHSASRGRVVSVPLKILVLVVGLLPGPIAFTFAG